MLDQFSRTELLIGKEGIEKLNKAKVAIFGIGGVGSFVVEGLARAGIGNFILIDDDKICLTNLNRQIIATTKTVGKSKVEVAKERILDINPKANVEIYQEFFMPDSKEIFDESVSYIVDAIDTVESKIALYKWCVARNIPFAASMGAALKSNPEHIRVGRILKTSVCPLAARVRKMVREAGLPDFPVVYSTEEPNRSAATPGRVFGSIITITGAFGLRLADIAIKYLCTNL